MVGHAATCDLPTCTYKVSSRPCVNLGHACTTTCAACLPGTACLWTHTAVHWPRKHLTLCATLPGCTFDTRACSPGELAGESDISVFPRVTAPQDGERVQTSADQTLTWTYSLSHLTLRLPDHPTSKRIDLTLLAPLVMAVCDEMSPGPDQNTHCEPA